MIPPINSQQGQQSNHVRSNSVPSLQCHSPRNHVEYSVTLVPENPHSSSAVNLLALCRENMFASQNYAAYFPKSPRIMPCMRSGAVTPMQLEEDLDDRFPNFTPTQIRHSPFVVPLSLEEESMETENFLEMSRRNR
jgi:hypothetical protein